MIKTKASLITVFILLCDLLNGQFNEFDISKYKLPDIKLNTLEVNTRFTSSNSKNVTKSISTTDHQLKSLNGLFNINYYYFRNTRKYQGYTTVNVDAEPYFRMSRQQSVTDKQNDFATSLSLYSLNRFYPRNKFFYEAEIIPNLVMESTTSSRENNSVIPASINKRKNKYSESSISIPLSIGYGRIEPVEDARLAIYILEELSKIGKISGPVPDELILQMAGEISKLKRKRFFDTRVRKIEELQAIDSFLVANNMISESDIKYFTILNDNWSYSAGPARNSGFLFNAGLNNEYSFTNSKTDIILPVESTNSDKQKYYVLGGFINFEYAKPINLYWQASANLKTYYDKIFTKETQTPGTFSMETDDNVIGTDASCSIQYLPNSRTSIKLELSGSYNKSNSKIDDDTYHGSSIKFVQNLEMYYYISPRFRVQLDIDNNLSKTKSDNSVTPNLKYSEDINRSNIVFSMIYSIF